MNREEAIHRALCSIEGIMARLDKKLGPEFEKVDTSLKAVPNTGEVPQQIAGRNPKRTKIWIHNAGNKDLLLAPFNGEIHRDLFSIRIAVNDTLIMSAHNYAQIYKDDIYGFWAEGAASDSKVMVTEFILDE